MKQIIIITTLVLITTSLYSQITKGNWITGGSASFRASDYQTSTGISTKQTIVQLSGDVSYFIANKIPTGIKLGYNRVQTNNPHLVSNTYEIGPLLRYYLLKEDSQINIFTELSYQFGLSTTSQGVKQNSNNLSGNLGVATFFNSSVALEFGLGYSSYRYNNNLGKVTSVIANIGFHFHLEKDK